MDRKPLLLTWTPEIYFLLMALGWIGGNDLLHLPPPYMQILKYLPLVLLVLFTFYHFWKQRLVALMITALSVMISLLLAGDLLQDIFNTQQFTGQAMSVMFFALMVIITNLTMIMWMIRKYRLLL